MFNAPKQNCMRDLERFQQSSILSKNPTALFPPKPSVVTTLQTMTSASTQKEAK